MCLGNNIFVSKFKEKSSLSFSSSKTLYVGGNGPDNYTFIRDAVYDANLGDTVFVYSGIYYEYHIDITKSINLIGENKDTTIVDARNNDWMIFNLWGDSDGVNITGFQLLNSGSSYAGITTSTNNHNFYDNIICSHSIGIQMFHSYNVIVENNEFSKCYIGVDFYEAHDDEIINNTFHDCTCGITPEFSNFKIVGNTFRNNYCGVSLEYLNNTIVSNNVFINNIGAIYLGWAYNNSIWPSLLQNRLNGSERT